MGTPSNRPLGSAGSEHSWYSDAVNALDDAYEQGTSAIGDALFATTQKIDHLVDQIAQSSTWAELRSIVYPILGEFSYDFGVAVGLAESVGDLVKGLFQLQRMLVLAALYEEVNGSNSHPGRSLLMRTVLYPAKVLVLGLNASGAWPTLLQDMKEADDQVRGIISEVEGLIQHPINSLVNFTTQKWGSRWRTWQGCVDWWAQCKTLYDSGEPKKMYEAGVMMGKLVGNVVLTVLAIVSMYGAAVRAAQLAAVGGRVALGLVSLETAETEALAADAAMTAARATGNQAKIAQAAERLKAAQLQRTFAQLRQRAPNLFKSLKGVEELPAARTGVGAGAEEDAGAGASGSNKSSASSSDSKPPPKPQGSLSGNRTKIPAASNAETTRSLMRENESAEILANNGYDVVQNPAVVGPKNPDYLVNGEVYDNYAPSTSKVRNLASEIEDKVISGQTNNVVVNLADSPVTPAQLQTQLSSYPIQGLNSVIVIDQAGAITTIPGK